jgi:hypothetical protein
MHSGYSVVIGLIVLGFGTTSCADPLKPAPSPAHTAFLAWALERGYDDLQPWPRRGSPGTCWAPCQYSAREVWYKIGACPGEWFSLVRVVPHGDTWHVEEFVWRPQDIEGNGPPPEGVAACHYG